MESTKEQFIESVKKYGVEQIRLRNYEEDAACIGCVEVITTDGAVFLLDISWVDRNRISDMDAFRKEQMKGGRK